MLFCERFFSYNYQNYSKNTLKLSIGLQDGLHIVNIMQKKLNLKIKCYYYCNNGITILNVIFNQKGEIMFKSIKGNDNIKWFFIACEKYGIKTLGDLKKHEEDTFAEYASLCLRWSAFAAGRKI